MRALLPLLALCVAACQPAPPQREEAPKIAPVAGWPQIPGDTSFGQVSAVDVDSHGHVFVLHRAGREWTEPFPAAPIAQPTVFMFGGTSGKLLAQWGAGQFIMPHGLSVDGQDAVWITDVGREQVFRFGHDGEEELALGTRGVSGSDARHFGRPTDVAFAGDEVLVSDGYVNTRVARFTRAGRFLGQWGSEGEGEGQFHLPHAVAFNGQQVFVADRENARVQIFDSAGAFRALWREPGGAHPYSLKPMGDGRLLVVEARDGADRFGAMLRIYRPDGKIERSYDAGLPGESASLGHDLAIAPDGAIYLADVYGNRVVKFRLDQDDMK